MNHHSPSDALYQGTIFELLEDKAWASRVDLGTPEAGQRAMQLFESLANHWALSRQERSRLLAIARDEYDQRLAGPAVMTEGLKERLGLLVRIYAALRVLNLDSADAGGWLRKPNSAPTFNGCCPLDFLLSQGIDAMRYVASYLYAYAV